MTCNQPGPFTKESGYRERRPRDCKKDYCLCRAQEDAQRRCLEKGEGWRYGL